MAGTTKTLQRKNFKKPPIIFSPPRRASHQQISSSKRRERSRAKSASVLRKHRLIKNKKCMGMQNNATKNQQNHSSKEDLINTNTVSLK